MGKQMKSKGRATDHPVPSTVKPPRNRNRKPPLAKQGPGAHPLARSRVTNGSALFCEAVADGRRGWSRRIRDLIAYYVAHLGGEDNVTTPQRSIIRRAAISEVEIEWIERNFAASKNGPSSEDLDLYFRATNALQRRLELIGMRRVARDVTTLSDYLNQHADTLDADIIDADTLDAEDSP
jgi:hypothetical protein